MTRTLPEKSLHVLGAFNISTKDDISGYLPSAAIILGDEIFHHNSLAVLFAQEHLFTVKQPAVPVDVVHRALREIHERADAVRRARFEEMAAEGVKYLEENREREGVNSTESGLQFRVINQGDDAIPARTDHVRVHYTGKLIDGTVFDSSVARGEPAEFPVNGVIAGWIEALTLMPVGSKWELTIPHNLAYGERGAGASIPPFSTLVFEVELLEIL